MIDVMIVPTLNQEQRLHRLLATIDHPIGELVVVDNGYRWPRGFRLPFPVVRHAVRQTLIELPANLGVAGAWNLGIKVTPHATRWLMVNDDAWFAPGSLGELDRVATPDVVTFAACQPAWSCFVLGADVVRKVGLFDERFHPAYFEDTDYARRCEAAGVTPRQTSIPVNHENSSTLATGIGRDDTFGENAAFHALKTETGDMTWGWDLDKRRTLGWEPHAL